MKKNHTFFIVLCSLLCGFTLNMFAYNPTTKWPYLYPEFQDGNIIFSNNKKTSDIKLNIHLQNATLHYLDGDKILKSNPTGIVKIEIGSDIFIFMNGELVRVVKEDGMIQLVKLVRADMKALTKGEAGAYGMTTEVSATNDLSSFTEIGVQTLQKREDGRELPLIEEYYFIINEKIVEATRKEIEKNLSDGGRTELKTFLKQNKIKWKDESSLIRLLDFFHQ